MIIIGHHPPDISIHALRKESDRMIVTDSTIEYAFQSTLSVRRATVHHCWLAGTITISIHALRKESDRIRIAGNRPHFISIHALRKESDTMRLAAVWRRSYFNPRSP